MYSRKYISLLGSPSVWDDCCLTAVTLIFNNWSSHTVRNLLGDSMKQCTRWTSLLFLWFICSRSFWFFLLPPPQLGYSILLVHRGPLSSNIWVISEVTWMGGIATGYLDASFSLLRPGSDVTCWMCHSPMDLYYFKTSESITAASLTHA